MIPTFPAFKKLELGDRDDVVNFVSNFQPYSDFNFVSLWTYNILEKMEISKLFGNLVVKFQDYQSDSFFYSFLGANNIAETITSLLNKSKIEGLTENICLIPEECINKDLKSLSRQFNIYEDRDNFDYICSVDNLADLAGGKWRDLRYEVKLFPRRSPDFNVRPVNICEPSVASQIETLFRTWEETRHKKLAHELKTIKRLLCDSTYFDNLVSIGVYVEKELVAWGMAEIVDSNFAVYSYHKANMNYSGVFGFLDWEIAKELKNRGIKYINYEQDLGIPGLRHYKESLHPVSYLKKYTISQI